MRKRSVARPGVRRGWGKVARLLLLVGMRKGAFVFQSDRYAPDGALAVYRSRNGGRAWERLARGLPRKGAYLHVFREGLATDARDPCGVYLGTSTGQLFQSRTGGTSWELLADFLPPVFCVAAALVEA